MEWVLYCISPFINGVSSGSFTLKLYRDVLLILEKNAKYKQTPQKREGCWMRIVVPESRQLIAMRKIEMKLYPFLYSPNTGTSRRGG